MPRYFVYMSAQGLLLAGKISEWKFKALSVPRDKCDITFCEQTNVPNAIVLGDRLTHRNAQNSLCVSNR